MVDETLLSRGVPADWIGTVQEATEGGVLDIAAEAGVEELDLAESVMSRGSPCSLSAL